MENTDDLFDQPLSDDPEENLRMENELLRLKLQAELGADPQLINPVDPEIENIFLKNIFDFEHNYANAKRVKVYELLGKPEFKPAGELSDQQIDEALHRVINLLFDKSMVVDFSDDMDSRTKYTFITEELFEHETDDLTIPGMTTHFDYEEFHPNHKVNIENKALEFLSGWFKQSFSERSWELSDAFISPDRKAYSRNEIVAQLKNIFGAYIAFKNEEYFIYDIGFQLQSGSGLGHAEGSVKYDAVLENNETIHFEGPFKLYLSMEDNWWSIFHIVFPGFKYP
ncbi:hypothetical protein [Mucilaginibacter sp. FT3.2]|uniref:hypothetical protein n=1 Tax=Mucilaginibacter sp. FT3.2 TaxID=2723090 RepID=UPI00161B2ADF|nr:hypothetical protein [Mucilaginibacter sp. FT3.2]MBB6232236.1 hypothetical protein [Mucilaginibacter sp. FT3.2]